MDREPSLDQHLFRTNGMMKNVKIMEYVYVALYSNSLRIGEKQEKRQGRERGGGRGGGDIEIMSDRRGKERKKKQNVPHTTI